MEIKKSDIYQNIDPNDLLDDLINKYSSKVADESNVVANTFWLIIGLDGQINNGGLIQFIDNGSGDYYYDTLDAANRIGSTILVDILIKVSHQFPNGNIPKNWNERRVLLDKLFERYDTLKSLEELNIEEKQLLIQKWEKSGNTISLNQFFMEQIKTWNYTWDELDNLYYDNCKVIYQELIEYLKKNAIIIIDDSL